MADRGRAGRSVSRRAPWVVATLCVGLASATHASPRAMPVAAEWPGAARAAPPRRVEIATRARELAVYEGGHLVERFAVSVGRDNALFPSPEAIPARGLVRASHRVRPGQTLWSISRRYGVDVFVLRAFNPSVDAYALRPGQRLRIPHREVQLTPYGEFRITNKTAHPAFQREGELIPPFRRDPRNEFGVRWIGLSGSPYGIHGTNEPNAIGEFNSRGCVRMSNRDVARLYELVELGTPVYIH